jgi:hypothetical protein
LIDYRRSERETKSRKYYINEMEAMQQTAQFLYTLLIYLIDECVRSARPDRFSWYHSVPNLLSSKRILVCVLYIEN